MFSQDVVQTGGGVGEEARGEDTGGPRPSCPGRQSGQPGVRGDQPPPAPPICLLVLQQ